MAEAARIIDEALDECFVEVQRESKRSLAEQIAEAGCLVADGVDWKHRQFIRDGKRVEVPRRQWLLFERLVIANGAIVTRDQLFHHLFGDRIDGGPEGNVIAIYICKLRKLCPYPIKTSYAAGYSISGVRRPIDDETRLSTPSTVAGLSIARLRAGR